MGRSLTLSVCLFFDSRHVGGSGCIELAHKTDARSRLTVGNRNEQVIAHRGGVCVDEVCGQLLAFGEGSCHDTATPGVRPVAALVSFLVLCDTVN